MIEIREYDDKDLNRFLHLANEFFESHPIISSVGTFNYQFLEEVLNESKENDSVFAVVMVGFFLAVRSQAHLYKISIAQEIGFYSTVTLGPGVIRRIEKSYYKWAKDGGASLVSFSAVSGTRANKLFKVLGYNEMENIYAKI
jgi:hypothetical protein